MNRFLLSLLALTTVVLSAFGQAPENFKYQAVIRDAGNTILTNQAVGIRMTIQQGSIGGTTVYQESFSPTTNNYGLINLEIGNGTVISGDFSMIDWGNGPYFIETAVDVTGGTNYVVMGTSQLLSVPYAIYANTAENVVNDLVDDADADPTNELQDISLTGSDLTISNGSTIDLSVLQDGVTDADADPTNELQDISLTGSDLTISNGSTIDLSVLQDGVTDADADPTNELQDISLTGSDLTISNGSTIDLSVLQDGVTDADADPTNELQDISLTGSDLTISNGSTIDLSVLQDGVTDADADPTNELQDISLTGSDLTISNGSTIDLSVLQDGVTDADADPTNELQTISRTGTTVTLSNGGGSYTDSVGVYTAGTGIDVTNNVISTSEPTYTIGLYPELGGFVFWVSADGKHGLVVETQTQGLSNWFSAQNLNSRPLLHTANGQKFRDWRLPTRFEMTEIYALRASIGLGNYSYWTSTESDVNNAYIHDFSTNTQSPFDKSISFPEILGVRSF